MVVLALVAIHVLLPQRSGVLALTAVFEPFLVLGAIMAVPPALLSLWRPAVYVSAIVVVVALVRYEPLLLSPAMPVGSADLTVATWNVLAGPRATERTLEGLTQVESADFVGLVELQPRMADALLEPDLAARYPHRALAPDGSVYGVGLISRFPILEHSASHDPPSLRALVDTPGTSTPTVVYVVHPLPARIRSLGPVPVALDTARRDADLARIRASIEIDLAAGRPVIVLGDLNTTEREPAYGEFVAGLRDAHLDAGFGPGLTWRPENLSHLPFGLLRIDYVLASPSFSVGSSHVICRDASDHCLVVATLDVAAR